MVDDPFDTPEFRDYAQQVREELIPKLVNSSATLSLIPEGSTDVKFAVELGLSIMMDKPIIAVIKPGTKVPNKLVLVADYILECDSSDKESLQKLSKTLQDIMLTIKESDT